MRSTLEARVGFEPTNHRVATDGLSPLGYRVWHAWKELNLRSRVWSPVDHRWLRRLDAQEGVEPS